MFVHLSAISTLCLQVHDKFLLLYDLDCPCMGLPYVSLTMGGCQFSVKGSYLIVIPIDSF